LFVGVFASLSLTPIDRADGAEVVISINKATQSMSVLVDGTERHNWAISSGLAGGPHDGTYRAGRMERKWFSRKYDWAPMPHSIFFDGNYAIHGTNHIKRLGRTASKGCVRLHPANAAVLFELVRANHGTTTVVVSKSVHVAARPPEPKVEVSTDVGKAETAASAATKIDSSASAIAAPTPAMASGATPAPSAETLAKQ
jgi:hypothetical protein